MLMESKTGEAPDILKEYVLAQEFGWTLEYIRMLSDKDMESLYTLSITKILNKNFDIINMMAMTTSGKSLI